jgi:hypothetical protein
VATCESLPFLRWELTPTNLPADDLRRWAEVLAAHRIDANGAAVPMGSEELLGS